jgi:hypothetical protein
MRVRKLIKDLLVSSISYRFYSMTNRMTHSINAEAKHSLFRADTIVYFFALSHYTLSPTFLLCKRVFI